MHNQVLIELTSSHPALLSLLVLHMHTSGSTLRWADIYIYSQNNQRHVDKTGEDAADDDDEKF